MTREEDEWNCDECGNPQGRHDMWFEGICENCNAEKEEQDKRKAIEIMLLQIFSRIGIDKPNNLDEILDFCLDDVNDTADPVDWHDGDVAIAFRRWIEAQASEVDN